MKIYTHQPKEFIESLLNNGIIYTDEVYLDKRPRYFKFAYNILLSNLDSDKKKLFTHYPIWCWYKIESGIENDGIKIKLDVPDDMVVLMDYYDWGGGALYYSEIFLNELLSTPPRIKPGDFTRIEDNIKNSLNIDIMRNDIQAIIPYIKLEWITNLDNIKIHLQHI